MKTQWALAAVIEGVFDAAGAAAAAVMCWCRLVIDEADTMFDQGFGEDVTKLLGMLKSKEPPVQVMPGCSLRAEGAPADPGSEVKHINGAYSFDAQHCTTMLHHLHNDTACELSL